MRHGDAIVHEGSALAGAVEGDDAAPAPGESGVHGQVVLDVGVETAEDHPRAHGRAGGRDVVDGQGPAPVGHVEGAEAENLLHHVDIPASGRRLTSVGGRHEELGGAVVVGGIEPSAVGSRRVCEREERGDPAGERAQCSGDCADLGHGPRPDGLGPSVGLEVDVGVRVEDAQTHGGGGEVDGVSEVRPCDRRRPGAGSGGPRLRGRGPGLRGCDVRPRRYGRGFDRRRRARHRGPSATDQHDGGGEGQQQRRGCQDAGHEEEAAAEGVDLGAIGQIGGEACDDRPPGLGVRGRLRLLERLTGGGPGGIGVVRDVVIGP